MKKGTMLGSAAAACVLSAMLVLPGCWGREKPAPPPEKSPGAETPAPPPKPPKPRIGVIVPMTGESKAMGESFVDGLKLALDQKGAAANLNATHLDVRDCGGQSTAVPALVRELITEDDVSVLAGPLFPACVESAADIAKDAQVTVLTPVPSALRLPAASTVTRLTFTEEQEGAAMAEFAVKTLRLKTAGMVVDGKLPASEERADAFRKKFTSLGGKVLVQVGYSTGDKSFRRAALMISRTKPGVIYLSGAGPDSAAVVAAMKDAKLSGVIVGSSDWNAAENPPEALPGKSSVHVPARFNPASSDPAVKEFVAAFKRDVGRDPDALAALGYDAGLVICQALQRATSGHASAVTKEIAATAAVPGVTGKLTAKNGVIAGTVEVMKVNGRETVFETSIPVQ